MGAVSYIYGYGRFVDDITEMTGDRPSRYWTLSWRFFAPSVMVIVFVSSVGVAIFTPATYNVWDRNSGKMSEETYPRWARVVAAVLVLTSIAWIPTIAILRHLGLSKPDGH